MTLCCRRLPALAAVLLLTGSTAFAQGGSQATPLPPSGRTTQEGAVVATQSAVAGATTSVNTISPVVQPQGALVGSVAGNDARPFSGSLTFSDAVARGLAYNLGTVNLAQAVRQSRGQRTVARSALLPRLTGDLTSTWQQLNLAAMGFQFGDSFPDFSIPSVVGPFSFVDLRARLSQTVFDMTAWDNYRAASETVKANELSAEDTRDLVVLAVGGAYLQTAAAQARADSMTTQVETADALYRQTVERREAGIVAQIDVDRSQIQLLTQQLRLTALRNEAAKQRINLARMIGIPPTDAYRLTDSIPFAPLATGEVAAGPQRAQANRADLQAAAAQVRAAERALDAAHAERLPTVTVSADYGRIGPTVRSAEPTFSVVGRIQVPIWEGGRTEGHIAQAETVVARRRAELDDLTSQVEGDVRNAILDLDAAADQVNLARQNIDVARGALGLTRQRFDAGIGDSVEVIQAQEAVATAELDYINAVFAHNLGKLNFARTTGQAAERLSEFLTLP